MAVLTYAGRSNIRVGDEVEIICGKDHGKRGRVLRVVPRTGRMIVDRINMQKKHQRPNQRAGQQGGIVEINGPIHHSNLMLVCPSCHKRTRIGLRADERGNKNRICRRQDCGAKID